MKTNTRTCLHLGIQYFAEPADPREKDVEDSSAQETKGTKDKPENDGLPKSQEELDAIIEKRLRRERKKMQQAGGSNQQDSQTDRQESSDADTALKTVNRELMIARAQLEAYQNGVNPDAVSDAVCLAVMQAEKDGEFDEEGVRDALKEVLKRRPEWQVKKDADSKGGFKVGVDTSGAEQAKGKGLPKGKVIF